MELLNFKKSKKLLNKYNIPFPATKSVASEKDLKSFVNSYKFPVVLKVFSPNLLHRTEKDLIVLNINSYKTLKQEFSKLKSKISGQSLILIQKQFQGIELILGMKKDKSFGPAILFGVGGIFVEILNDVSWGIAPLNLSEAQNMINNIKAKKILKGYRGKEKVDIKKLAQVLVNLSNLALKENYIKEIDFNPVIASKDKCLAVDFKFLL